MVPSLELICHTHIFRQILERRKAINLLSGNTEVDVSGHKLTKSINAIRSQQQEKFNISYYQNNIASSYY